jgi:hypothetical protein
MSKLVLTHTGSAVPDYTEHCIKQVQYTNPGIEIDLVSEYNHGIEFVEKFKLNNVHVKAIEDIQSDFLVKRFREVSWFKAWGRPNTAYPSPDNFVQGTSERLFLLAAYLKQKNIKNVWHIENDNLIYGEFDSLQSHLCRDKITCCYMNPKHTVWNLVFIPDPLLLYTAMQWYVDQLAHGNDWVCKTYGLEMAHEMTVMSAYKDNLCFFPSLPNENKIADYYFDPASYGQYIGGTNNGHPPGFRDTVNHVIGQTYGDLWNHASMFFGYPHVSSNKFQTLTKLFNLHVHNKHKMKELSTYA